VSKTTPEVIPWYIPSINTPTVGSMDGIDELIPRPRIAKLAPPLVEPISSIEVLRS